MILLDTLVISRNFLLEFFWLSVSYKKLNYIASYIYTTVTIYWSYLLHNHVDMLTNSKSFATYTFVCP